MLNFTYENPTKIVFGRNKVVDLKELVPAQAKVMITYGGNSAERSGLLDEVRSVIGERIVSEFGGITANPKFERLIEALPIIKEQHVDFLLAVGGGSVIDGTKFIAAAAMLPANQDPWTLLSEHAKIEAALPLGTILTLPATGSEMNGNAVVSRLSTGQKLDMHGILLYPLFSILDPEYTFSLPPRQIANGIVDSFVHVAEQYLTYPVKADISDRFAESVIAVLLEQGPQTFKNPHDYESRANFMWAATMALNGLIAAGVPEDWATHYIGHQITALKGIDHGRTLAAILPSLLRYDQKNKQEKILQLGNRVLGTTTVEDTIKAIENFFLSLDVPVSLKAYDFTAADVEAVIHTLQISGLTALGEKKQFGLDDVRAILEMAMKA